MGGCRCTYKNCSVKSDGKTHMFHYPVLDKTRCLQWLMNSRRHDFLDLKVSQLKNRVICQHHFMDQDFMNYRKDKLKRGAVPTLDGMYCDLTKYSVETADKNECWLPYDINFDDIDNDAGPNDRQSINFSMKYGDFLVNGEVDMNLATDNTKLDVFKKRQLQSNKESPHTKPTSSSETNLKYKAMVSDLVAADNNNLLNTNDIYKKELEIPEGNCLKVLPITKPQFIEVKAPITNQNIMKVVTPTTPKIKILSEKPFFDPVPIIGKLEPVSPSTLIFPKKDKNKCLSQNVTVAEVSRNMHQIPTDFSLHRNEVTLPITTLEVPDNRNDMQLCPVDPQDVSIPPIASVHNTELLMPVTTTPIKMDFPVKKGQSILKNKITAERVAAIEKKRKFNMKLRDIIEAGLDKLDGMDSTSGTIDKNKLNQVKCILNDTQENRKTDIDYDQNKVVSYLEETIKKMENILAHTITQSSQSIMELKELMVDRPSTNSDVLMKKSSLSEDHRKKQLYDEISKYLSPDTNCLVYEELFVDKFEEKITNSPKRKRRKIR